MFVVLKQKELGWQKQKRKRKKETIKQTNRQKAKKEKENHRFVCHSIDRIQESFVSDKNVL